MARVCNYSFHSLCHAYSIQTDFYSSNKLSVLPLVGMCCAPSGPVQKMMSHRRCRGPMKGPFKLCVGDCHCAWQSLALCQKMTFFKLTHCGEGIVFYYAFYFKSALHTSYIKSCGGVKERSHFKQPLGEIEASCFIMPLPGHLAPCCMVKNNLKSRCNVQVFSNKKKIFIK